MSINDSVSVRSLCGCKIAKAVDLSCVMFDLSQVLRCRAIEKDRSPGAIVAGFTCSNLHVNPTCILLQLQKSDALLLAVLSIFFSKKVFKAGNTAEAFAKNYWQQGKFRA